MRRKLKARNAGSGAGFGAILLIGIVVVAAVVGYTYMTSNGGFSFDNIGQWFNDLIHGIPGGGSSGNITGTTWTAFKLYFADGTTQDINMQPTFALFPMSITFNGKELSKVDVLIRAQLNSQTSIGAWSSVATQHLEIYKKPETTPKTSSTGTFTSQGQSWTSGETKTLQTTTIQASTLDSLVAQYGSNGWLMQSTGTVKLTISGSTLTASLNAGGLDFSYATGAGNQLSISSVTGNNLVKYPFKLAP